MGYKLTALTLNYKIGDTPISDVITTNTDISILKKLINQLEQEVILVKRDMRLKLAVLSGRYHNYLYGLTYSKETEESRKMSAKYYQELTDIEKFILLKYETVAKYFKYSDLSKLNRKHVFKIINIEECR